MWHNQVIQGLVEWLKEHNAEEQALLTPNPSALYRTVNHNPNSLERAVPGWLRLCSSVCVDSVFIVFDSTHVCVYSHQASATASGTNIDEACF